MSLYLCARFWGMFDFVWELAVWVFVSWVCCCLAVRVFGLV